MSYSVKFRLRYVNMLDGVLDASRYPYREADLQACYQGLRNLEWTKSWDVTVDEARTRLPSNLRARIKILVRELAAFNGLTYAQMNRIVHDKFYPVLDATVGGVKYHVTPDTNQLTPDEAQQVEADLYELGGEIGCPLSIPQTKGNL